MMENRKNENQLFANKKFIESNNTMKTNVPFEGKLPRKERPNGPMLLCCPS